MQLAHCVFKSSTMHLALRRERCVVVRASGGFGKSGAKVGARVDTSGGMAIKAPKQPKQQQPQKQQQQQQPAPAGGAAAVAVSGSGWATVGKVSELFTVEKPAKPIITASGVKLCVYKFGNKVYASDLESTAYRFPLFDGKLSQLPDGRVVVEVPLDGTQYDLATGAVVAWCPAEGGNPLRGVLGALKRNQPAVPLKVYPTQVTPDGTLMVKLI